MKQGNRGRAVIAMAFVALLLMTTFTVNAQESVECVPADGPTLEVGAVFPEGALMTARNAEAYQGTVAMIEAINACGGVKGRPVSIVFEPATNRRQGGEAAQRLVDAGLPLIIGTGAVGVSEGVSEVAEVAGVVYWEVTEPLDAPGEWGFTTNPSSEQLGELTAQFALETLPDLLGTRELKTALIYEDRTRGQAIADGIRDGLPVEPLIKVSYTDFLGNTSRLGVDMREMEIDVVFLVAFNNDADRLWFSLREADANIGAWIHTGNSGFLRNLCSRYGNHDGVISIDTTGPVSLDYRETVVGDVASLYQDAYVREFSEEPSNAAELSAAGTYMLLRYVLPEVNGDLTPENIREAIMGLSIEDGSGLMGEGLQLDADTRLNERPGYVVQQRQEGRFCTLGPNSIATCFADIQPFPTWRERALLEESTVCSGSI